MWKLTIEYNDGHKGKNPLYYNDLDSAQKAMTLLFDIWPDWVVKVSIEKAED